jgi:hypothetical protein
VYGLKNSTTRIELDMADTSAVAPAPAQSLSAADNINGNNTPAMQSTNTADSISTADITSAKRKRIDEDTTATTTKSSEEDSQQVSAQTQSDILALLITYASRSHRRGCPHVWLHD